MTSLTKSHYPILCSLHNIIFHWHFLTKMWHVLQWLPIPYLWEGNYVPSVTTELLHGPQLANRIVKGFLSAISNSWLSCE